VLYTLFPSQGTRQSENQTHGEFLVSLFLPWPCSITMAMFITIERSALLNNVWMTDWIGAWLQPMLRGFDSLSTLHRGLGSRRAKRL
jgi:hypothetical protein